MSIYILYVLYRVFESCSVLLTYCTKRSKHVPYTIEYTCIEIHTVVNGY